MLFDGHSKDISMLQSQINRRATNSGWNYLTRDIITIKNTKKEDKDLITEYACLSEDASSTDIQSSTNKKGRSPQISAGGLIERIFLVITLGWKASESKSREEFLLSIFVFIKNGGFVDMRSMDISSD